METIKTIVDTDLLIDLLRNKKEAVILITRLEKERFILCTTAINIFELHHGAHKSNNAEKNVQAISKVVRRMAVLPLTSKSAQKAGHLHAELEKTGHPIGLRDTFIAAIALTRECSVATRNIEHFSKISDLKIISA
ncbi:MAG: type II toxin-antitoxin system VapC family toxin [Candidatus Bathyarchaeia archaeon]|jgi:tRNA(fMet)-specific endonuclease VapC